jgi:hypothetical protein
VVHQLISDMIGYSFVRSQYVQVAYIVVLTNPSTVILFCTCSLRESEAQAVLVHQIFEKWLNKLLNDASHYLVGHIQFNN